MANSDLYALLIGVNCYYPNRLSDGSSYRHLQGAVGDVAATRAFLQTMRQVPDDHIFQLTSTLNLETGEPIEPAEQLPTYKNIVQKFQALTQLAPTGSHVYIHYSGHGGRTKTNYPQLKGGESGIDEALVPIDVGRPDGQYLRDIELGKLLKDMVAKGLIVTVVLDSCHSGGATRGDAEPRGVDTIDMTPRPISDLVGTTEELAASWSQINSENTRGLNSGWLPESRDYVLLAACRPNELAYEYAFDAATKQRSGALTYWLLDSLRQQTSGLTYKDLHDRLNGKIRTQFAQQTPMLMGEGDRLVFGSDRADIQYTIPVISVDPVANTVKLEAGQATGLRLGAEFAIYPNGTRDFSNADDRLAIVKIGDLGSTNSTGTVEPIFGQPPVQEGDVAILIAASTNLVKKVRLLPQQQFADESVALNALQGLLRINAWLSLAAGEETCNYIVVINAAGEYEICDQSGTAIPNLRPPIAIIDPNATRKVVDRLVHLAKYHATEALDNFDKNSPLFGQLQLEWLGKLSHYDPSDPIPEKLDPFNDPSNPTVQEGEWAFLKIQNNFSRAVNVAVLDLQSNWAIEQCHPVEPGSKFVVVDAGKFEILSCPLTVPSHYSQAIDIIKVFAAIDSPNFRWLELPVLDQPLQTLGTRSGDPLEAMLFAIGGSAPQTRDINAARYPSKEWTTQQTRLTVIAKSPPVPQPTESRSSSSLIRQIPTIIESEELVRNMEKLAQGQNAFSFRLFHALSATASSNLFISPLSVAIVLLMVFNASQPNSATQMAMWKLLELKGMSPSQLNDAAHTALTKIQTELNPNLTLNLANSIWRREDQERQSSRIQTLLNYYDAEVRQFGLDLEQAATSINHWISHKTADKLQNVVDASLLDITTVLINAVYFKGTWQFQFDPAATQPYLSDRFATPQQMMMSQSGQFDYYESEDFQAIRLPYANSPLCMDILLPRPEINIADFQTRFELEDWQALQTIYQMKAGTISLPRFKVTYRHDLCTQLRQLTGLENLYLQPIAETDPELIEAVIHQTFLEVNEAGSEAAGTTVIASRGGSDTQFSMTIDRPFICIIHHRESGIILFMGAIIDPTHI
jgi:serine protease inhibitor